MRSRWDTLYKNTYQCSVKFDSTECIAYIIYYSYTRLVSDFIYILSFDGALKTHHQRVIYPKRIKLATEFIIIRSCRVRDAGHMHYAFELIQNFPGDRLALPRAVFPPPWRRVSRFIIIMLIFFFFDSVYVIYGL